MSISNGILTNILCTYEITKYKISKMGYLYFSLVLHSTFNYLTQTTMYIIIQEYDIHTSNIIDEFSVT